MNRAPFIVSIPILFFLILIMGCVSLERETPQKHRFSIQLDPPRHSPPKEHTQARTSLLIRRMQISPSFAGKNLVYKIGPHEFESDYYNEFLVAPEVNIYAAVMRWLENSQGLFRVVSPSSQLSADYILESNIYLLYGDFSSEKPAAVMEIKFVLLDAKLLDARLEKRYHKRVILKEKSASALIEGYRDCLLQILQALQEDLKKTGLKPHPSKDG